MDIEKRIATIQVDQEALLKRRSVLLSQVERIRDEISRINEEILRCQGAFQILQELKQEQPEPKAPAPTSDGCPVGGAGGGD
jgi:prefoldin subunit 5